MTKLTIIKGRKAPERMLKAQSLARAAKKEADYANRPSSIAKATVMGIPGATRKIATSIASKLRVPSRTITIKGNTRPNIKPKKRKPLRMNKLLMRKSIKKRRLY